jgi:Spy/CpxP family protein refolding chaperone
MKISVRILMGLLMMAVVASAAVYAHGGRGPGGRPDKGKMLERMSQQLKLTADQQARVKALFDQREAAMKAKFEARESQLRSILTAEQNARLDAMKANRQKGERKGPFAELNLTDEQKAKLQAMRGQGRSQMEAEHKQFEAQLNEILTPEQRTKLEQMRAQRGGKRGPRGGDKPPQ